MSGEEPVGCEELPLHTYAGALAITPASAGQQQQRPAGRGTTATGWGPPNNLRYSGDEGYSDMNATDPTGRRSHADLIVKMLGFSSSNAGNNPWGMGGVDFTSITSTVKRMLKTI